MATRIFARLLECLREEFPVLKHALTEEVFDTFAVGYLQHYPSRSYTLFDLGKNFPQYLADTSPSDDMEDGPLASWPDFLIDLATLEWTFNEVFDGPGAEGAPLLDGEALRGMSVDQMLDARFQCAP